MAEQPAFVGIEEMKLHEKAVRVNDGQYLYYYHIEPNGYLGQALQKAITDYVAKFHEGEVEIKYSEDLISLINL